MNRTVWPWGTATAAGTVAVGLWTQGVISGVAAMSLVTLLLVVSIIIDRRLV